MLPQTTHNAEKLQPIEYITIGAEKWLSLTDIISLIRNSSMVVVSQDTYNAMTHSYQFLKTQIDKRIPVYGINTNFGDQVNFIDPTLHSENEIYHAAINARQTNIIKSLACGLGAEVAPEIVKVTMMLRAHCLAQGFSGVHPDIVDAILAYLNAGITPIVRCYGSIGASGDLIPLGTIAACLLGLDIDVMYNHKKMPSSAAMKLAGLKKINPQLRDGLSMINGTSFMTATASLAIYDLKRLFNQLLTAISMSLEALHVNCSAYHPLVHQLKRQAGEMHIAALLMNHWQNSHLVTNHDLPHSATNSANRIQDYYSLRSVAQGFGPFYENINQAITWIENEINSVNDNPIVDAKNSKILHSANFMGYYVTDACDMLKMDIAQASSWVHALLANMVHARKNHDLPTNIVIDPGKNNGFRSMQLLAAAVAVQNRKFAQSHQAYMIPTEGDNQDVNSLGAHAALDLREAVANLERLTAILLLAATQALELRGIEKASIRSNDVYKIIRNASQTLVQCRPMTDEIHTIISLLKDEMI